MRRRFAPNNAALYGAAGGGSPGIDPATLATQWWDVSRSTLAANSNGTGTATVGSGLGYIAVAGSATDPGGFGTVNLTDDGTRAKPLLKTDGTLGKNYAEFTTASSNRLVTGATGAITQPFTRISLLRARVQPPSGDALIYSSRNSYVVMLRMKGGAANGTLAGDATGTSSVNFNASLNNWHVIIEEYNGASSSFQTDNNTVVTGNPGANNMGSAGLSINAGKDDDLGYYGDFDWMACFYFSGLLSAGNKNGVRTYLGNQIGLSL